MSVSLPRTDRPTSVCARTRPDGRALAIVPAVVLLVSICLPAAVLGEEFVALSPAKDNTLYQSDTGSLSNGSGEFFFAGVTASKGPGNPPEIRRGLIRFDLAASIPPGSTITSVTLTLTVTKVARSDPYSFALHRLIHDWGEGSSDAEGEEGAGAPAASGDATWLHTFYDGSFWLSAGGDYVGAASASRTVGDNGTYSWSSAGLVIDVQGWLDSPASNYGWVLIGDESTDRTAKQFHARENSTAASRPVLQVGFNPPLGTGACCDGTGGCTITTSSSCAGTFLGDGTSCDPSPCNGACCVPQGTCEDSKTLAECNALEGTYQGDGVLCSAVECPVLTGACCLPGDPGSCSEISVTECSNQGGTFQGSGALCNVDLCPFVDALPLPATATPVSGSSGGVATYDMPMTEFDQKLHRDLDPTTVWGFAGSFPGPTIEARTGMPVTVRWINDLRQDGVLRTTHYLPVDPCPHGADEAGTPRTVVHLHGGHVPPEVDGYPEDTFLPGAQAEYIYPNNQIAAPLWYHDHALGITRLNVYMGLAGLYLLRDDVEEALALPTGEYEVPLVIQDRAFHPDGTLDYPAAWQDHFFGDKILVNGKIWPYLEVDQGNYRFRAYNGSNGRVYTLSFDDGSPSGATFAQIGSEGGLFDEPVLGLTEITLSPGERADLVVDFAGYSAGSEIVLTNSAVAPYPSGSPESVVPNVMKFVVGAEVGDTTPLPATLRPIEVLDENDSLRQRDLVLTKETEPCAGVWWVINGLGWDDITEKPVLGTTEVWSFVNQSGVVHPMHMHLVFFQVLDRQSFEVIDGEIVPTGERLPPKPEEAGWKDTVQAPPNQITRVIARFDDYTGLFPYHCHVLEHEDHEMMRQFEVLGGTIRVVKEVLPASSTQTFVFTGDLAGTLAHGEQMSLTPLAPGTYSTTETVPENWELSSISCDDSDSGGDLETATAVFALSVPDVEAQQPLVCTFTNCILDLTLDGETLVGTVSYEACDSLTARNTTVQGSGGTDVTFRARNVIVLENGFVVESSAGFTALVDPSL